MKFQVSAASNIGCVRKNNEDMVLVNDTYVRDSEYQVTIDTTQHDRLLFALADGMGGHNAGEVASSDALHNLQFFFSDLPTSLQPEQLMDEMRRWLNSISLTIDSKSKSSPQFNGMGTTLVSLFSYNNHYYWMNCGDSRIYRLHEGMLTQLSTDHSLSTLLGQDKHSNVITNCIGGGCKSSYIDIVECTPDVQPGDTFLICSDGLSDMVSDESIAAWLIDGYDAESLCTEAEEAGGKDNVSAIVVRVL